MLSENHRRMIAWSEQAWFLHNRLPTPEELREKFRLTATKVQEFLLNEEVVASFEARGIPTIEGRDLLPEQVLAVNTVLNLFDTRSERKKLSDMNISPMKWEGWKNNPSFMRYYSSRAEKILGDAVPDAHMALVENVRRGDLGSVKFLYEITGRYTGKDASMDPRMIINKVFEIIARHVRDPETLKSIAQDLSLLVALDNPGSISPVAGTTVQGEIEAPLI